MRIAWITVLLGWASILVTTILSLLWTLTQPDGPIGPCRDVLAPGCFSRSDTVLINATLTSALWLTVTAVTALIWTIQKTILRTRKPTPHDH